ncbi:SDR family NAD(P)-dependent oxidoreductase [Micromonospora marina]|uniref:SDR family NAD(P)-dependent oxidoreductase n=1 Tax=Micromonospora marina TaxID=307120 RepID=UPI003D7052DB
MNRLEGRVALVTGSTSGIGRAIATGYAAEGATVVVHGRDKERADAVVERISAAGGRAEAILADLSRPGEADRLVRTVLDSHGGIDVVVNNAGVMSMGTAGQVTEENVDEVLAINFKAPLFVTRAALPSLVERGGSVVNVTTAGAHRGSPGGAVYAAAKAALHMLTVSWAAEFAPQGVRVNELIPGATRTPMMEPLLQAPEVQAMLAQRIPIGRVAEPEDLVGAAVFLASAEASYVTGAVLAVDGGFLAG